MFIVEEMANNVKTAPVVTVKKTQKYARSFLFRQDFLINIIIERSINFRGLLY